MRFSPIILTSVIALSGCATNQVKEMAPIPIPAKSLPKVNIEPDDTAIIGIALNKSFGGFPECPIKRDIFDKNKFEYELFPKDTCYKRFNKIGSNEPLGTEKIYVDWSVTNDSMPFYIQGLKIELLDGVVHGIEATTRGLDYQTQIANDLINKFGTPKTNETNASQNKMGAKFNVRHLTWSLKNKTSVSFIGALTNIKEGYIFASTERMSKIKQLENENREAKRPKL